MWFKFYTKKYTLISLSVIFLVWISALRICGQSYFGYENVAIQTSEFNKIQIDPDLLCQSCSQDYIGNAGDVGEEGITFNPEGDLFSLSGSNIYTIDTISGISTFFYGFPPWPDFPLTIGFVYAGPGLFYTISQYNIVLGIPGDSLILLNTNNGIITTLGYTGWPCGGEITIFNGEFYYVAQLSNPPLQDGIVKLNVNNPSSSELMVTFPLYTDLRGLTASHICNTLITTDVSNSHLFYINLLDGAIIPICELPSQVAVITTLVEFETPTICDNRLDLDCDDSSGATEADFNTDEFDCLSNPVLIADNDIGMLYDAIISEMTIQITGSIPNAPFEILTSTGNTPNIVVSGEGTDMITLTNAGGAKSTDFKDALRLIRYNNIALLPTAGVRTVEVQFTTESGSTSNVAAAYIEVNELPLVDVDLGPDVEVCEGESVTFNAGNPGADYEWSTGASSQTLTVDEENEYIVTVSDEENCPNQDTVELTVLPVVHVALEGQFETCDNVPLTLTLNTDSPFPLTIEILATPGGPFVLNDVIGVHSFNDVPSEETEYTITSVVPSQPACIEISDPIQLVDVYPSYINSFDVSICDGDSIWLGFYWETETGVYENTFSTSYSCDSVVTVNLSVLPAITINAQGTTCDSASAGVFFEYLNNPNGCDTVIQTTVTLLSADTTYLTASSCSLAGTGIFTQTFSNQSGCDSLVITTVNWTSPTDTTRLFQTTCDSAQIGVFQQMLVDQMGCDSLVITTVDIGPSDTTHIFGISCDINLIGISQALYNNQQGCDSLVITTINAGEPDTSYLSSTSCDSASLGVFEEHFVSIDGCDSVVITTITYSAKDSIFINGASCNPEETGIFIDEFVNQFGCDSIVTTTITLLPSDAVFLASSTCDPPNAGVFVETLVNQYGCDSIVTTTVELLPSDETFLSSTTCMSSQAGTFVTTHQNQFGCDSILSLTVTLVPADTTYLSFKTCDPGEVGNIENTYTNQEGCDSLVIEQTTLYPIPDLQITTSDFNGYGVSCYGEADGSASAQVNGVSPFTYLWSTNDPEQSITGIAAGTYSVSVTDGNGCTTTGGAILNEPDQFSISLIISHPNCFDAEQGSITVDQSGGIDPIRYSIDGVSFQSSPVFDALPGGTYTLTVLDAHDCEAKEIIWINVPLMVNVELGDDMQLFPGDTTVLNAIVNVPFDSLSSVVWSGLNNPDCPTCLTQPVAPLITTTYSVTVESNDGCRDEDALTLFLESNSNVYVPNIFSPNSDDINDKLVISIGDAVEGILEFTVFDRWGNVVYTKEHIVDTNTELWDGKMKGKALNPGVFAYKMIIKYADGTTNNIYGDVTIVR